MSGGGIRRSGSSGAAQLPARRTRPTRCTARRHGSERDTPYVACVEARSAESRQSREAARRQWWDEREAPLLNAIGRGAASRKVLTELGIIVQAVTAHRRRSDATSADRVGPRPLFVLSCCGHA